MTFELKMEEDGPAPLSHWTGFFVLDEGGKPVIASEAEWRAFEESGRAKIADTDLGDGWSVTTFFDGRADDEPEDDEPLPPMFVTVARMGSDGCEWHWDTLADAKEGHDDVVRRLSGAA